MSEFNISVPGGESKRLKTGGKYCPADIVVTAEGRVPVEEKDVNFYDYDGTLLYSFTAAQAAELLLVYQRPICIAHRFAADELLHMLYNLFLIKLKRFSQHYLCTTICRFSYFFFAKVAGTKLEHKYGEWSEDQYNRIVAYCVYGCNKRIF